MSKAALELFAKEKRDEKQGREQYGMNFKQVVKETQMHPEAVSIWLQERLNSRILYKNTEIAFTIIVDLLNELEAEDAQR